MSKPTYKMLENKIKELEKSLYEYKKIENKINEQNCFLRDIINVVTEPVFYKDTNGRYLGCNKAFEDFMGIPEEEIIGKTVFDINPEEIAEEYFKKDNELFKNPGSQTYECKAINSKGQLKEVVFNKTTFRDVSGNVKGIVGVITDITERKLTAEALLKERSRLLLMLRFETLLANITSKLNISTNLKNTLNEVVLKIEKDTGIHKVRWFVFHEKYTKMLSKYDNDSPCDSSRNICLDSIDLKESSWFIGEIYKGNKFIISDILKLDIKKRKFLEKLEIGSAVIFPMKIENNGIGAICFSHVEKYDWKQEIINLCHMIANIFANSFQRHYHNYARLEAEKKEVEAVKIAEKASHLASLGTLAAGIAHEINQPLNALKMTTDIMIYWKESKKEMSMEEMHQNLIFISEQTDRIHNIIKQIRTLAKQEKQTKPNLFNLNDSINNVIKMVKSQLKVHRIDLVLDLDKNLPPLKGYPTMIEQVIVNLALNALQALDSIERTGKEIRIITKTEDEKCIFEIVDNGPGIPAEYLSRIGDPFFTTKLEDKNMGLGLSIVENIVTAHNGTIFVKNRDDGGAHISILIPYHQELKESE